MVPTVLTFIGKLSPPCELALAEGHCSTKIHSSRYLVCVNYRIPVPTANLHSRGGC